MSKSGAYATVYIEWETCFLRKGQVCRRILWRVYVFIKLLKALNYPHWQIIPYKIYNSISNSKFGHDILNFDLRNVVLHHIVYKTTFYHCFRLNNLWYRYTMRFYIYYVFRPDVAIFRYIGSHNDFRCKRIESILGDRGDDMHPEGQTDHGPKLWSKEYDDEVLIHAIIRSLEWAPFDFLNLILVNRSSKNK
jgi:hypothetical protein